MIIIWSLSLCHQTITSHVRPHQGPCDWRLTLEAGVVTTTSALLRTLGPASVLPGLSLSRLCLSLTLPGSWSILGTKCDSHTLGPHQWPLQFSARLMPPLLQSDLLNQCQTAWFIFWMEKKRVVKLNVRLIFYLIHLTHCWHCSWLVPVFLAMCPHPSSSWCSWTHLTVVTPHDLINTHLASNWGLL